MMRTRNFRVRNKVVERGSVTKSKTKKACVALSKCIVRQFRIAARHGSGSRNSRGLTGNVGLSSAARCASDEEFILFCKTTIWVNNWLTAVGFLSWCKDNSSILACLARSVCFFATNYSQFSIVWHLLHDLLGRDYFSIPILHTSLFCLFDPDQPIGSPVSLFPMLNLHVCLSFVQFLLSQFFFIHGQLSFPFTDVVKICQFLNVCTTFLSRSLFSLDTESNRLDTTVSQSMSAQVSLLLTLPTTKSRFAITFVRLVPIVH